MNLKELIKIENPVIFEAGANNGDTTVEFYNIFKNPTIYCFEPGRKVIQQFKAKNLPAVITEAALSDTNGYAIYHSSDNNELSGSIKNPLLHKTVHTHVKFNEDYLIKTIRLDDFVEENKIEFVSYFHLDVQGAEDKVIGGGLKTFLNKVQYLFTEFSNVELYEGNLNRFQILDLLPGYEFVEVVREWRCDGDCLLKNTRFND